MTVKVAITASPSAEGWRASELSDQAQFAESLGFHSIWIPENHFGGNRSIPSPLTLLASMAATTKHIGLGTTSYLLPIRRPLQAAEEVAVLDQLSNGRVILGIGRGVQDAMFKAFDLPTKDKRKRFQQNLDIMLNAWRGGEIIQDNDGKPVFLGPLPVQQPHPVMWVAAFGPLALKQAGNLGLPYLASPVETLNTLANNYQQFNDVAETAGHLPIKTVPVMRTVFVSDDKALTNAIKVSLSQSPGHAMREDEAEVDDWTIIGDSNYVAERLAEYVSILDLSHLIIRGQLQNVSDEAQRNSYEALMKIATDL